MLRTRKMCQSVMKLSDGQVAKLLTRDEAGAACQVLKMLECGRLLAANVYAKFGSLAALQEVVKLCSVARTCRNAALVAARYGAFIVSDRVICLNTAMLARAAGCSQLNVCEMLERLRIYRSPSVKNAVRMQQSEGLATGDSCWECYVLVGCDVFGLLEY